MADAPAHERGKKGKRGGRRWLKWGIRVVVGLPLLLVVVVVVGARSPLVGWVAGGQIEKLMGCEFSCGSSVVGADGRVVFEDVVLRAPGVEGEGGQLLSVERVVVDMDWGGTLGGGVAPIGVRLERPVVRFSQEVQTGRFNIDALDPEGGDDGGGVRPPSVVAVDGVIEIGEHGEGVTGGYRALKRVAVGGALLPTDVARPRYKVELSELVGEGEAGLAVGGVLDLEAVSAELALGNVELDAWDAGSLPPSVRGLWGRLEMSGTLEACTFSYSQEEGVRVEIRPGGVAMNALVPADRPGVGEDAGGLGADEPLRLTDVTGSIRISKEGLKAEVRGVVGDQVVPSELILTTEGLALDSPLRCEITTTGFVVAKDAGFLRYTPRVVRKRFASFSGPTAEVDARVLIERGSFAGEVGDDFVVEGSLVFRNGRAQYEAFAYPIEQLRGRVTFDDDEVRIVNIEGRGPSGALISAQGRIWPPTDEAAVELEVLGLDIAMDEHLEAALPGGWGEILDVLFNKEQHAALVDEGLIITPGREAELVEQREALLNERVLLVRDAVGHVEDERRVEEIDGVLGGIQEELSLPVVGLGGKANLRILIGREHGHESVWHTNVSVGLADAGLVLRDFPLPMRAEGVVLEVSNERAVLEAGRFVGYRGGEAVVDAEVVLRDEAGASVIEPTVWVDAQGVVIDDLLINAIPRGVGGQGLEPREVLSRLAIDGVVGCKAKVWFDAEGSPRFDVRVGLDDVRARVRGEDETGGVLVDGVRGSVHATHDGVRIEELTGRLVRGHERDSVGTFEVEAQTGEVEGVVVDGLRGSVRAEGFDLSARLEVLVGLIDRAVFERLASARAVYEPAGRLDGRVDVEVREGRTRVRARVSRAEDVSVRLDGHRVETTMYAGEVGIELDGERVRIELDGVSGELRDDAGVIALAQGNGTIGLGVEASDGDVNVELRSGALDTHLEGVRLGSGVVRGIAGWLMGEAVGRYVREHELGGVVDASVRLDAGAEGGGLEGQEGEGVEKVRVAGTVQLRELGGAINGRRYVSERAGGEVEFFVDKQGARAALEGIELIGSSWSVGGNGVVVVGDGGRVAGTVWARAASLNEDVLGALPTNVRDAMEAIELRVDGPVWVDGAGVELIFDEDNGLAQVSLDGDVAYSRGAVKAGVELEQIHGTVGLDVLVRGDDADYEIDVAMDRASVLGVELTDGRVWLTTHAEPNASGGRQRRIVIPVMEASCNGGRVSGRGLINTGKMSEGGGQGTSTNGTSAGGTYAIELMASGVRFADVLEQMRARVPEVQSASEIAQLEQLDAERASNEDGDPSRGSIDAVLSVRGVLGEEGTGQRVGAGSIRIAGGDVVRLPLVLTLIQLSNLQLPLNNAFDYMQTTFSLLGDTVVVDDVALMSSTVSMVGYGTIELPALELDMRFNSHGRARLPVLTEIFEGVRNELVTTVVRGTLGDPDVSTRALKGTRRMIGSILGTRSDDQSRALERLDAARRARLDRVRAERSGAR